MSEEVGCCRLTGCLFYLNSCRPDSGEQLLAVFVLMIAARPHELRKLESTTGHVATTFFQSAVNLNSRRIK